MCVKKVKIFFEFFVFIVLKILKFFLNIIYVEMVWFEKMKSWVFDVENVIVEGNKQNWFYKLEFSFFRNQYEV